MSNKEGLVPLAQGLLAAGYQLISSGTAAALAAAGSRSPRSPSTGAPKSLAGASKPCTPVFTAGFWPSAPILPLSDLADQGIAPIDVVVVNLYPFRETIARPGVSWDAAIENIDIGGPAMVRAAAKNHADVAVLTSPAQYPAFLEALGAGAISPELRRQLALEAFSHTAEYDTAISQW